MIQNYRKRKSVIVKHSSPKVPFKMEKTCEKDYSNIVEFDEDLEEQNPDKTIDLPSQYVKSVQLSIDIPAIDAMCTKYLIREETNYLESIKLTFEQTWNEISLGERIIEDYIRFCKTKKEFSLGYMHMANRQMR